MDNEKIKQKILNTFDDAEIQIEDPNQDGHKVFLHIKSDHFKGLNRIKQHQAVMAIFESELAEGKMHAISIKTETKSE